MCAFKIAVSSGPACVNDSFRNPLVVKVEDLLSENVILKKGWPPFPAFNEF